MTDAPPNRPRHIAVLGHHDLDGVISASIAGRYLQDRNPGVRQEYGTVDFHLKATWPEMWATLKTTGTRIWDPADRTPAPEAVALVDFPLPPMPRDAILFYADHHPGAFELGTLPLFTEKVESGAPAFHRITGSCADLLLRSLKAYDGWEAPASLVAAARLAHVVDTAGYATPQDAMRLAGESPSALDLWITRLSEEEAADSIGRLVSGMTLHEAFVAPYQARYDATMELAVEGATQFSRFTERLTSETVLVDTTMTVNKPLTRVRFLEYADPRVRYAVGLSAKALPDGRIVVLGSLGRSPWAPALPPGVAHPDLGAVAKTFGDGGGHPYAAGFRVMAESLAGALLDARIAVSRMLPYLTALPLGHRFADPTPRPAALGVRPLVAAPLARRL